MDGGDEIVRLVTSCELISVRARARHSPVGTDCVMVGSDPVNRSDVIDAETKSRGATPS